MRKVILIFITLLLSSQLISQLNTKYFTFYCPPFLSIKLDTAEWIVPYEKPCYLYANSPFEFKSSFDITHKNKDLRFRLYCLYDRTTTNSRGKYISEYYGLDYSEKKILSGYSTFVNPNNGFVYLADTMHDYGYAMIETNCKLNDIISIDLLVSTWAGISFVEPIEIDQFVGYPFSSATDIQKVRNQRVVELRRNLKNGMITKMYKLYQDPVDTAFFDFFFMRDRLQEYSFTRYHNLRIQDCKGNYSLDEHLNYLISDGKHPDDIFLKEYAGADLLERINYADAELSALLAPESKMKSIEVLNVNRQDSILLFFMSNAQNWQLTRASGSQTAWETQSVSGQVSYALPGTRSLTVGAKFKPNFAFNYFENENSMVLVSSVLNHTKEALYPLREGRFVVNFKSEDLELATMGFEKFPSKADYIIEVRGSHYCGVDMKERTAGFSEFYSDSSQYFHYNIMEVVDPPKRTVMKVSDERLARFPLKNPAILSPVFYSSLGGKDTSCWQVLLFNNEILDYCINTPGLNGWERKEGNEWKAKLEKQPEVRELKKIFFENHFRVTSPIVEDTLVFQISTIPYYAAGLEALIAEIKKNSEYPVGFKTECLFGRVEVSFLIDSKGFVQEVSIDKNETGFAEMDVIVMKAMKEILSFVPATLEGRNVPSKLKVVIPY